MGQIWNFNLLDYPKSTLLTRPARLWRGKAGRNRGQVIKKEGFRRGASMVEVGQGGGSCLYDATIILQCVAESAGSLLQIVVHIG